MKTTLKTFGVFKGSIVGRKFKAKDINDLLDNKLPSKLKESFDCIQFKDELDRTITIRKDFLDQGMSIEDCIQDHIENCPEAFDEEIHTI